MENVQNFIAWALMRTKRSSIPKGAILAIDTALVGSILEAEYLWGTSGRKVTQSLLDARYASYYSKNKWTKDEYARATAGWVEAGKYVSDCQGVLDWYMGKDTNANGNYNSYCTDKGLCSKIGRKFVIGEALFNGTDVKKTHVGWVCGFMPNGDVLAVENRGLSYGLVITKRSWKYRGLMTKKFAYDETPVPTPTPTPSPTGSYVTVIAKSVNIRSADNTSGQKLGVAKTGDSFPYIATAPSGWYQINYNGNTDAYISNRSDLTKVIQAAIYNFTRVLKVGVKPGQDVADLKALLIAQEYTAGITAGNTSYGSKTAALVKTFQRDAGLTVDGKAGQNTIKALSGNWAGN